MAASSKLGLLEFEDDSDLSDLSESDEQYIVSHMTDEEKEQYDYIRQQVVRSTARGKKTKDLIERVLDVTSKANPGIPDSFATHLMHNIENEAEGEAEGEGSDVQIPDDPDVPLIIKIVPSSLKLPVVVKKEVDTEEFEESAEPEMKPEISEFDDDDYADESIEEMNLEESEKVDRPEVLESFKMLQDSAKQQLDAYN